MDTKYVVLFVLLSGLTGIALGIPVGGAVQTASTISSFKDGTEAPRPLVSMSEDGFKALASFPASGSTSYGKMPPTIERWQNGVSVATCPRGYHFDVANIDPINSDQPGAMATCEPNPAPTPPKK